MGLILKTPESEKSDLGSRGLSPIDTIRSKRASVYLVVRLKVDMPFCEYPYVHISHKSSLFSNLKWLYIETVVLMAVLHRKSFDSSTTMHNADFNYIAFWNEKRAYWPARLSKAVARYITTYLKLRLSNEA